MYCFPVISKYTGHCSEDELLEQTTKPTALHKSPGAHDITIMQAHSTVMDHYVTLSPYSTG